MPEGVRLLHRPPHAPKPQPAETLRGHRDEPVANHPLDALADLADLVAARREASRSAGIATRSAPKPAFAGGPIAPPRSDRSEAVLRQALGRSRGGYGTKAVAAANARGRASAFDLPPGLQDRASELGRLGRVIGDRVCSSKAWRDLIAEAEAGACGPANRTHPPVAYSKAAHRRRHRVENLRARPQDARAAALLLEKTAQSHRGDLHLAAALDWLPGGA